MNTKTTKIRKMAGLSYCWSIEEDKLIAQLYKTMSCTQILQYFPDRTWHSLRNRIRVLKLKRRDFKLNDLSYLNLETPEAYYWLGLLMADGHFTEKRISITLHKRDKKHLEKFAKFIDSKNKIQQVKKTNCCVFAPADKQNVQKIIQKFNISSNKTHNPIDLSIFNKLPNDLFISFICGFIDGDGTVYKRVKRNRSYTINVVGYKTWLDNFNFMNNHLYKILNEEKRDKGVILRTRWTGIPNDPTPRKVIQAWINISNSNLIVKLKQEIIRLNLPFLTRKWDKIVIN